MVKRILMAIIFIFMSVSSASAGQVTLTWDAMANTDQVGIRIYMATTPNVEIIETNRIAELPINNVVFIHGDLEDGKYFFVATTYGEDGVDSLKSNECSKVISTIPQNFNCN